MKKLLTLISVCLSSFIYGQIPDWTETTCDGTTYNMYTELQNGNAVVLDFGAMWCQPCAITAPELDTVWQHYDFGTMNVKVFGFLFEDNSGSIADCSDLNAWESNLNLTYPGFANTNVINIYAQYNSLYGNNSIPLILLFIPDMNDPGNSALVYNYSGGDVYTGITSALSNNNFWGVGIEEIEQTNKEIVKILDLMGRETEFVPNTPLIYIYSDGTTERVFRMIK